MKLIYHSKLIFFHHPKRYWDLYRELLKCKPRRIMEIGVYHGFNAETLLWLASFFHKKNDLEYYGFDAFEEVRPDTRQKELAPDLQPHSSEQIQKKLIPSGARVKLIKGYTDNTLPSFVEEAKSKDLKMDLVFIDGGHSTNTIQSDWIAVKDLMHEKTVVIFDDYYSDFPDSQGEFGCQKLMASLDPKVYEKKVLNSKDSFKKEWGSLKINLAKVTKVGT